jgi:hypothetical protein
MTYLILNNWSLVFKDTFKTLFFSADPFTFKMTEQGDPWVVAYVGIPHPA